MGNNGYIHIPTLIFLHTSPMRVTVPYYKLVVISHQSILFLANTMGLFKALNPSASALDRIADSLELLVAHLTRGGTSTTLRTTDEDYTKDGSSVGYVDDALSFMEETRRIEHFARTGVLLKEGDPIPGPIDETGREWGSS